LLLERVCQGEAAVGIKGFVKRAHYAADGAADGEALDEHVPPAAGAEKHRPG